MKKLSHLAAAIIAGITLAVWGASGFHTGWTQTSIPVHGVDEITGIEYTTYQDGFVAGVDVLAAGLGLAIAISGLSIAIQFLKSRKTA